MSPLSVLLADRVLVRLWSDRVEDSGYVRMAALAGMHQVVEIIESLLAHGYFPGLSVGDIEDISLIRDGNRSSTLRRGSLITGIRGGDTLIIHTRDAQPVDESSPRSTEKTLSARVNSSSGSSSGLRHSVAGSHSSPALSYAAASDCPVPSAPLDAAPTATHSRFRAARKLLDRLLRDQWLQVVKQLNRVKRAMKALRLVPAAAYSATSNSNSALPPPSIVLLVLVTAVLLCGVFGWSC